MNKSQLKQFATTARKKLEEAVRQKAYSFGITKDYIKPLQELEDGLVINGMVMGERERKQYTHLKNRIAMDGYETVMSEAAYTWFNRFVALRYMEVNNFLPIATRILSSEKDGKKEPDALTDVLMLTDELDLNKERVYQLKEDNQLNNLYQYLLIKQSNKLGDILPNVFERITDDMALLLPDNLLNENSVVRDIVELVDEESWKEVEIVGWLYQFYISEEKDDVFKNLKKNKKIGKKEIGPATQLFTPRWIVEYMVDNSLGRLWLESHPDETLKSSLTYYLEDAEQEDDVRQHLDELKDPNLDIETVSFLDPSCGSGHILVYAFELFYKIYLSRGYREREIPKLILENNLYGLDIDKRAAQLATFALVMKAREFDKRLFSREYSVHVHSIEESNVIGDEHIRLFSKDDMAILEETTNLIDTFKDGKLYGSIIQVPEVDIAKIKNQMAFIREDAELDLMTLEFIEYSIPIIENLIDQYHLLAKKYNVVVTNPPYMGSSGMKKELNDYVKSNYPSSKSDLFSVFFEVSERLTKEKGYFSNINQQSWMYLVSFESLRQYVLKSNTIVNLLHLGPNVFEEINGEVVQSSAFVIKKQFNLQNKPFIIDLYNSEDKKTFYLEHSDNIYYSLNQRNYLELPSYIIDYKMTDDKLEVYKSNNNVNEIASVNRGPSIKSVSTSIRNWYEVNVYNIGKSLNESKWVYVYRDGTKIKWYNPSINIVKSDIIKNNTNDYYFNKESIIWPDARFGSPNITASIKPKYAAVESGVNILDAYDSEYNYTLLLYFNSYFYYDLLNNLVNGQHFSPIYIKKLPFININHILFKNKIDSILSSLKIIQKNSEIYQEFLSPFKIHKNLSDDINMHIENLNSLNNNIEITEESIINMLKSEIQIKSTQTSYASNYFFEKLNKKEVVVTFLSYLVGIMFGRYSLDIEGLAYAGGDWDDSLYRSYQPDETNIIPLTEDQYFKDDIMNKVEEMLIKIYGEETLEENLIFIAEALSKKATESSRDRIRRYFIKEFYKDHLKTYQKRPIYWQFTSGTRNAFKGLMYLHRYNKNTIAQLRTDYVLHEAKVIDNLIQHESNVIRDESSTQAQKARAQKLIDDYTKDRQELAQYDQVIEHVAKQQIDLDLDDGVKVNYQKFQNIEITDDHSSKPKKLNVFEKI